MDQRLERMHRTIKEAIFKRFRYETPVQLPARLADFKGAYNFAAGSRRSAGSRAYRSIAGIWTSDPDRFIVDSIYQVPD